MLSDDRYADGTAPVRSLSEQLRALEAEWEGGDDISQPLQGHRSKLPMSLGRPIGLTQPDGFPRILSIGQDAEAGDDAAPTRGGALRRGAAIAGAVLALFIVTAILPPLIWRYAEPRLPAADGSARLSSSGRTDNFANAARNLALAPHAPVPLATPTFQPLGDAPETPLRRLPTVESLQQPAETQTVAPDLMPAAKIDQPQPATTLEVAESDLPSLTLPKIVSGIAPSSAGSAVIIDGLPDAARVSPGLRIARDSWAVGIREVEYAVLSLPRDTPEQLDLVVRVVAADSHQLTARPLQIRVLRTAHAAETQRAAEVPPVAQPKARFEPASGVGVPELKAPPTARKPAVVLKRTPAPSPAWPTSVSAWSQTETRPAQPPVEKAPAWAPFQ